MSFNLDDFLHRHMPEFLQSLLSNPNHGLDEECNISMLQRELSPVRDYIHNMWKKLIRTHSDLFLEALYDPKVPRSPDATRILYISSKQDEDEVRQNLNAARERLVEKIVCGTLKDISEEDLPAIDIRKLPPLTKPLKIGDHQHSLMYLPYPYVVPGPRFNEMYNWDTAFVIRGLFQDKKFDLAKAFVENMLYQIEHYGTILNGNRTYYYDSNKSRSQPPILSGKIVGIYHNYDKLSQQQSETKHDWLKRALATAEKYYQHWVTSPHLHEESQLSMYNSDLGFPAFEVIHSEKSHYDKALKYLREMYHKQQSIGDNTPLDFQDRKDRYYLEQYYIPASKVKNDGLSRAFYRGDRAMRETGFDPSRRFGFFNVDVINYLPVCLNSLRYKMEREMGEMYRELANYEPEGANEAGETWRKLAHHWSDKANQTGLSINSWLWDKGVQNADGTWQRKPCYHDFNINKKLCEKYNLPEFRDYDFISSFYPMWVGISTPEQAADVVKHLLPRIKTEWGVMASSRQTGAQWDKPFMWAPLVVITVEALERYSFNQEALEVCIGFLKLIAIDFKRTGKLYEKYDAVYGSSDVSKNIAMGYSENVEGFAWTNSAVLELTEAANRISEFMKKDVTAAV